MKIAIGCDHAGFPLKDYILSSLKKSHPEHEIVDYGCAGPSDSVDYPKVGQAIAHDVVAGKADKGILVCGSGIGISIAANRVKGARAALCSDVISARLSRQHNDANILCFGNWFVTPKMADEILQVWLNTAFEGERHQRRIDLIDC